MTQVGTFCSLLVCFYEDADSFHSCFSADESGYFLLDVGTFRCHPRETQVSIFGETSGCFATVTCVFWKMLRLISTDLAADFLASESFLCSQRSACKSGYFRQDVETLCSRLFAKKKLLFVARHRDTLQSAFCQQKQVFCYKKLKHNSSKQLKNKIIGERWPRSFSSKCSKQVELLHIIPGLYYIFDGKIMIYCGGKKWDLRWISCPAFMSDNLSCSHMISIKVLNNVKSFIFNGLSAMSHLLQRAGVFSHSDQVWRWPFQGIISARLSWVWTPRSSHVETKIRAKCCISVFHQAPC